MNDEEVGVEKNDQSAPSDTEVEVSDSGASAESQDSTDYKALYEKAVTEKENYKTALTQKRQLRQKPEVEEVDEDEDKPLTRKDLKRVLQEEITPVIAEGKVEAALQSIKDPAKRQLVKFYYDNRIRQTGTSDAAIHSDIETAIAIADGQKSRKVLSELSRKENTRTSAPMSGSMSDRTVEKKNHKFSDAQIAQLTATASRIGADPQKFIDQAWKNQHKG